MIRKAVKNDISAICGIYSNAREFMKSNGNPTQWGDTYPTDEIINGYISSGNLYVEENDCGIGGVFALVFGRDETYAHIEEGSWLNDEPYASIHIVASSGKRKGFFERVCNYSKTLCSNLRVDTHHDNIIMQNSVKKQDFRYCGHIFVADGTLRLAYQWCGK